MEIINRLKPKNYEFRNDGNYATMGLPGGTHYGLLAQDLEKVLPNLVKEEKHEFRNVKEDQRQQLIAQGKIPTAGSVPGKNEAKESIDVKAVNYMELIPIMIKAMQEMDADNKLKNVQIEDLQNQVNELKSLILKGGSSVTALSSAHGYLKNNIPNLSK